jgi:hypothetical protein
MAVVQSEVSILLIVKSFHVCYATQSLSTLSTFKIGECGLSLCVTLKALCQDHTRVSCFVLLLFFHHYISS